MKFANSINETCMSFFLILPDSVGNPREPPETLRNPPEMATETPLKFRRMDMPCRPRTRLAGSLPAPCHPPYASPNPCFQNAKKCFQLSFLYCPFQYAKKSWETEFVFVTGLTWESTVHEPTGKLSFVYRVHVIVIMS